MSSQGLDKVKERRKEGIDFASINSRVQKKNIKKHSRTKSQFQLTPAPQTVNTSPASALSSPSIKPSKLNPHLLHHPLSAKPQNPPSTQQPNISPPLPPHPLNTFKLWPLQKIQYLTFIYKNISTFRSLFSSVTQAIILKPKKILFMYTLYLSINIVHLFWHANKYVANK